MDQAYSPVLCAWINIATNALLAAKGFHVPRSFIYCHETWHKRKEETLANIQKTFTFPCIIKPHDDGCSVFVSKITNHDMIFRMLLMPFLQ